MTKESLIFGDNFINQGERAYVISLLKKLRDVCNQNIKNNTSIIGYELIKNTTIKRIYRELTKISQNKNWYWREKANEFEKEIYDNIRKHKVSSEEKNKYVLNYMERSFVFMEADTILHRSMYCQIIEYIHWRNMRISCEILIDNLINTIKEKEINKVTVNLDESGKLLGCDISYGAQLKIDSKSFDPENLCEKYLYGKSWGGRVYDSNKKVIESVSDYCTLEEYLDKDAKPNKNFVDILQEGIQYKRNGQYEKAKDKYIEAIHIDNTHPNGYYNLAKVLYLLEDYRASVKAYMAYYERSGCELMENTFVSVESFYINLGHSLLDESNKDGEYKDIIDEYRQGVEGKIHRGMVSNKDKRSEYEKICIERAMSFIKGE